LTLVFFNSVTNKHVSPSIHSFSSPAPLLVPSLVLFRPSTAVAIIQLKVTRDMTCRCELGNEMLRLLQRCIKCTISTTPPFLSVIIGSIVTRPPWELVKPFVVSPFGHEAHVKRPVSCARSGVPCRKNWGSSHGRHAAMSPTLPPGRKDW
jgi:hypothetical protein